MRMATIAIASLLGSWVHARLVIYPLEQDVSNCDAIVIGEASRVEHRSTLGQRSELVCFVRVDLILKGNPTYSNRTGIVSTGQTVCVSYSVGPQTEERQYVLPESREGVWLLFTNTDKRLTGTYGSRTLPPVQEHEVRKLLNNIKK